VKYLHCSPRTCRKPTWAIWLRRHPPWDYHPGSCLAYNPQQHDVILVSTRLKHRQSLQPDGNYLKCFDYEIETM
jgi:hypothetical protein